MMHRNLDRIAAALCAGQRPLIVARQLAVAFATVVVLCGAAAAFMALEPLA